MLVLAYDSQAKRSNPYGALVRFEASSDVPIVKVELDLEGDGEPAIPLTFEVGSGFDGRFVRALAAKFTANGTWPLVVTASDVRGRTGSARCTPGITVTF